MKKIQMVDLVGQYEGIQNDIDQAVLGLSSQDIISKVLMLLF